MTARMREAHLRVGNHQPLYLLRETSSSSSSSLSSSSSSSWTPESRAKLDACLSIAFALETDFPFIKLLVIYFRLSGGCPTRRQKMTDNAGCSKKKLNIKDKSVN